MKIAATARITANLNPRLSGARAIFPSCDNRRVARGIVRDKLAEVCELLHTQHHHYLYGRNKGPLSDTDLLPCAQRLRKMPGRVLAHDPAVMHVNRPRGRLSLTPKARIGSCTAYGSHFPGLYWRGEGTSTRRPTPLPPAGCHSTSLPSNVRLAFSQSLWRFPRLFLSLSRRLSNKDAEETQIEPAQLFLCRSQLQNCQVYGGWKLSLRLH
jgi:hypothetical protein